MDQLPIIRVVLYKHGVGYFEREGTVDGDAPLALTFKQAEVSDVLKSLTVLDLNGGHIASVSYDSTKPLEQLLQDVALEIPDVASLVSLLPQIKGARVRLHAGAADPVEGAVLGIDHQEKQTADGIARIPLLSILTDQGEVRSFDLHGQASLTILDPALRRDLEFYLRTQLSSKKKDARTFTFFARGQGKRAIRLSYTLEAPVWKATYRILLGEEGKPPMIQGWAVVDNTQDEDWENVQLSLIAGLPVSFIHDLYTPRYIKRPEVRVQETTGVLPPTVEEAMLAEEGFGFGMREEMSMMADAGGAPLAKKMRAAPAMAMKAMASAPSSMPAQVRERKIGDLFEYEIEHPVTIRRNQSALVPIVLRGFEGRPVLLYNKGNRADNPMRCVEFKNTTGLTLEGGPVTVLEGGAYVGEAMLETIKPDEERLVPFAVELSVHVLDNVDSHDDRVTRVSVSSGVLHTSYLRVQQTTYHLNNKADGERILYLEHPRGGAAWQLFGPIEPKEVTENYWRFRLTLPAKEITKLLVRQRQTLHQSFGLTDLSDHQLAFFLEQKYLDERTARTLRRVVDLRRQLAEIDWEVKQLEKEKAVIFEDQKRIRDNLQALGERTTEKGLRERFVKSLNDQEDRLLEIDKEIKEKAKHSDVCRAQIKEILDGLAYEAEV